MTVADLVHRIRRQHPNSVDRGRIQIGPVVRVIGASKGGDVFDCCHQLTPQIGKPGPPHTLVRRWQSPQAASRIITPSFTETTLLGPGGPRGLPSSVVEAPGAVAVLRSYLREHSRRHCAEPNARDASRLPRADQTAGHRASAGHHHPGDAAGRPRNCESAADSEHPGGWAAGGRRRQHAELCGRRRHRQADEAHRASAAGPGHRASQSCAGVRAGAIRRLLLLAVVDDEHAVGASRGGDDRVLRARLHAAAQAPHIAERGVGRCGRLHAGDDRLVGGDRDDSVARAGDVRDHLLLDAAAHVGAGDALQGGLQARPACRCCPRSRPSDRSPSRS